MSSKNVNIVVPEFKAYQQDITLFHGIEDINQPNIHLPDPPNIVDIDGYRLHTDKQKWTLPELPDNLYEIENNPKKRKLPRADKYKSLNCEFEILELFFTSFRVPIPPGIKR